MPAPARDAILLVPIASTPGPTTRLIAGSAITPPPAMASINPASNPTPTRKTSVPGKICRRGLREAESCRNLAAPMNYVTHLECAACNARYEAGRLYNLCEKCGKPLLVRYDFDAVRRALPRSELR